MLKHKTRVTKSIYFMTVADTSFIHLHVFIKKKLDFHDLESMSCRSLHFDIINMLHAVLGPGFCAWNFVLFD